MRHVRRHTKKKHFYLKTPEQLRKRLLDEPHIKAASSFNDQWTAENAIRLLVSRQEAQIAAWIASRATKGDFVRKLQLDVPLGISIPRDNQSSVVTQTIATIRLSKTEICRIFVLTAYPGE